MSSASPLRSEEVEPADIAERVKLGEIGLVDCREAAELQAMAVDGAVHIPLGPLVGDLEASLEDLADHFGDKPIAIMCHAGVRSLQATLALRAVGKANVFSVAGGVVRWAKTVDPTVVKQ